MDRSEILAFITQVETEDVDPQDLASAYATAVDELQPTISNRDLKRLLLLGAAMFRNSLRENYSELQMPGITKQELPGTEEDAPSKGFLH